MPEWKFLIAAAIAAALGVFILWRTVRKARQKAIADEVWRSKRDYRS